MNNDILYSTKNKGVPNYPIPSLSSEVSRSITRRMTGNKTFKKKGEEEEANNRQKKRIGRNTLIR
ncbi:hypothetical protein BLOT_011623 [Blomia tropicalis]|nr:hypothetical protein BLOT_011623 [Blomia tropicalis]